MATQWLRRGWLLAACASGLLLASCGGGDIVSQLNPSRVVAFGDASADVGQNGRVYSINNDGTVNNWTKYVANAFGKPLAASAEGGLSYAIGNARVALEPDAAGSTATPTVTEQIDTFLQGGAPGQNDLVIVNAGTSDVIVHAKAVFDGTETSDQAMAEMKTAGQALGAQVRRLVSAGGKHVVVVGPYNLGNSPWSVETGQGALLKSLTQQFNEQMLVSIVDLGASVLYVDAAYYYNLVTANPG
ncbi:MAG TPA: SGNH/GDSL hydrolase family protein, partial [Methylomirabilota bacterium]|nr:SGNH/GDSL hydrolase family protein [Methylomirabilota bacterium]